MDQQEKQIDDDFNEDEQPWRPVEDDVEADQASLLPEDDSSAQAAPEDADPDDDQSEISEQLTDIEEPAESESPQEPAESEPSQEPAATDDAQEPNETDEPEISTTSIVEAILFASDEPVTAQKLVAMVGTGDVKQIRKIIDELNDKYTQMECAFRVETIAGGYQMLTLPQFNVWLRKLLKVRSETKLSPAALETLAIIAYKQPILRVDIEAIRGVAAGEMVRQLIEKSLVKIVGRAEVIGRPLLYGTTKKFLEVFGLNNLKDLPTADELKKPE
ncbi:MAG: SMC-Scp complex subunit ScpB [Sedimentisphaerales bacterium]|nr:SMC-Scp complex subunit ScpB [Sedimentisphaerales bacterium]